MADHLTGRLRITDKVTLLVLRITPHSVRIPVPRLNHKLGILTIGHGLPTGVEDFLQKWIRQQMIGSASPQPVDRRAQRAHRTKGIHHVRRRRIDHNLLRDGKVRAPNKTS